MGSEANVEGDSAMTAWTVLAPWIVKCLRLLFGLTEREYRMSSVLCPVCDSRLRTHARSRRVRPRLEANLRQHFRTHHRRTHNRRRDSLIARALAEAFA